MTLYCINFSVPPCSNPIGHVLRTTVYTLDPRIPKEMQDLLKTLS